jgi:putative FmdB family regulatory protein
MPLYEYICTACAHEFEEMQKFSDPAIRKCPECGKSKVQKKVSLAGFQLKGAGWYKDGYSKSSEKSPSKSEGKGECKASSGSGEKSGGCGTGACKTAVA